MSPKRQKILVGLFAAFAMAGLAAIGPATASRPVPRTIVGCVVNGEFITSDGYHLHPRYADGTEFDLGPFEGHSLTISGDLLPGDTFIVKKRPRDSGPCNKK